MDNLAEWTEQLLEAEQHIAEAYNILATLQADLKTAGRKKDTQAIGEVVERLARYGRLFEDIRQSWAEVEKRGTCHSLRLVILLLMAKVGLV